MFSPIHRYTFRPENASLFNRKSHLQAAFRQMGDFQEKTYAIYAEVSAKAKSAPKKVKGTSSEQSGRIMSYGSISVDFSQISEEDKERLESTFMGSLVNADKIITTAQKYIDKEELNKIMDINIH